MDELCPVCDNALCTVCDNALCPVCDNALDSMACVQASSKSAHILKNTVFLSVRQKSET